MDLGFAKLDWFLFQAECVRSLPFPLLRLIWRCLSFWYDLSTYFFVLLEWSIGCGSDQSWLTSKKTPGVWTAFIYLIGSWLCRRNIFSTLNSSLGSRPGQPLVKGMCGVGFFQRKRGRATDEKKDHLMRERGMDERQTDLFSVTYPDPEIQ